MIVKENGFLYLKKTNVKRIISFSDLPIGEKFKLEIDETSEMCSYNYDKNGSIFYHEPSLLVNSNVRIKINGTTVNTTISFAAMHNLFVFYKPIDSHFLSHINHHKHTICDMDLINMGAKNLYHPYNDDVQGISKHNLRKSHNANYIFKCEFMVIGNVYGYNPDSKYTDPIRRLLFRNYCYSGYDEFSDATCILDIDNNLDNEKYYIELRKLRSSDLKIGVADNYQNNCIRTPLTVIRKFPTNYYDIFREERDVLDLDYTKLPSLKKTLEKIEEEEKYILSKVRSLQIENEKIENENKRKEEQKIRDYEQKLTRGEFPIKVMDLSIERQKNLRHFIDRVKDKKYIEFDLKRINNETYLSSMNKCIEFIKVLLLFREEEHKYNNQYHIKHKRENTYDSLFYKITYNSINYTITIHYNISDNKNKIWDNYTESVEEYFQSLIVESYNNLPLGRYLDIVKELRKLSKYKLEIK